MLDRAQAMRRDPQRHIPAQRFADQGDHMQVRQEAPTRLVVGVADIVTGPDALAGDFAATSHDEPLKLSSDSVKLAAGYRVWGPARQLEKPAKSALKRSEEHTSELQSLMR